MLEVLSRGTWSFGGGCLWHQKLEGQVTKCRWFGRIFYVRENLIGSDAFYISANERQGEKGGVTGHGRPTLARNILEVCTSDDRDWPIAADVVRSLDPLRRPVRRHRLFTVPWAEATLAAARNRNIRLQESRMPRRRFEFVEGSSAKFYEVEVQDRDVTICFGRLGTSGQSQTKTLADHETAAKHAEKLIKEKLGKGYVESQPA